MWHIVVWSQKAWGMVAWPNTVVLSTSSKFGICGRELQMPCQRIHVYVAPHHTGCNKKVEETWLVHVLGGSTLAIAGNLATENTGAN